MNVGSAVAAASNIHEYVGPIKSVIPYLIESSRQRNMQAISNLQPPGMEAKSDKIKDKPRNSYKKYGSLYDKYQEGKNYLAKNAKKIYLESIRKLDALMEAAYLHKIKEQPSAFPYNPFGKGQNINAKVLSLPLYKNTGRNYNGRSNQSIAQKPQYRIQSIDDIVLAA